VSVPPDSGITAHQRFTAALHILTKVKNFGRKWGGVPL